jgi:hypothetical protein
LEKYCKTDQTQTKKRKRFQKEFGKHFLNLRWDKKDHFEKRRQNRKRPMKVSEFRRKEHYFFPFFSATLPKPPLFLLAGFWIAADLLISDRKIWSSEKVASIDHLFRIPDVG